MPNYMPNIYFSSGIECLILSQPRWKKSQRCTLHSLEAGTARGWGAQTTTTAGAAAASGAGAPCGWGWAAWGWGGRAAWRAAWDAMRASAREHVTLVHFNTLHDTLHNYLRKHRFCADCKTKVGFWWNFIIMGLIPSLLSLLMQQCSSCLNSNATSYFPCQCYSWVIFFSTR